MVTWHSGPELPECLSSLAEARRRCGRSGSEVELVLVDNASPGFRSELVSAHWPDSRIVINGSNRGFGPAANQGIELSHAPAVLLLNPDTRAVGDPFSSLLRGFSAHQEAVALAPRLAEADDNPGETQRSFQLRHLPTWGQALRELMLVDKIWPANRWLRRDRYLDRDRTAGFSVQQPAAAALAVRREVLTACGGFDERFVPAWFEDVDLCARLAQFGDLRYWPDAVFEHQGGVAARGLGYDRFLPIYYTNAVRYWRKHHGAAAARLFGFLVVAGMLLRLAALPLRRELPRGRREAARAYGRVMKRTLLGSIGVDRSLDLQSIG